MKIFLSWSGARSRAVAGALNEWLPRVIQAVKPFYSLEIEKGAKWSNEIDDALEGTRFGVICLTPDNLSNPWIHFEAGALSKTKDALVWTFLSALTPGDIPPPLGRFQHTIAEKSDVLRLLKAINRRIGDIGGEPLQERLLEENFEVFWPRLEEKLRYALNVDIAVEPLAAPASLPRDQRAILDEILELVRSQGRRLTAVEELSTSVGSVKQSLGVDFYRDITAPVLLDAGSEAATIANNLRDAFLRLAPGSNVEVSAGPKGPAVRVTFLGPIPATYANNLVKLPQRA